MSKFIIVHCVNKQLSSFLFLLAVQGTTRVTRMSHAKLSALSKAFESISILEDGWRLKLWELTVQWIECPPFKFVLKIAFRSVSFMESILEKTWLPRTRQSLWKQTAIVFCSFSPSTKLFCQRLCPMTTFVNWKRCICANFLFFRIQAFTNHLTSPIVCRLVWHIYILFQA